MICRLLVLSSLAAWISSQLHSVQCLNQIPLFTHMTPDINLIWNIFIIDSLCDLPQSESMELLCGILYRLNWKTVLLLSSLRVFTNSLSCLTCDLHVYSSSVHTNSVLLHISVDCFCSLCSLYFLVLFVLFCFSLVDYSLHFLCNRLEMSAV